MENENLFELLDSIGGIVEKTDLTTLDKSGTLEELPDGFYLCEIVEAEPTVSKTSGAPMFKLTYNVKKAKVTEVDERGYATLTEKDNFNGRKIWKYYPIKDEKNYQSFVKDMCELAEGDQRPFQKEMFNISSYKKNIPVIFQYATTNRLCCYIQIVSKDDANGNKTAFKNILKWDTTTRIEGLL